VNRFCKYTQMGNFLRKPSQKRTMKEDRRNERTV